MRRRQRGSSGRTTRGGRQRRDRDRGVTTRAFGGRLLKLWAGVRLLALRARVVDHRGGLMHASLAFLRVGGLATFDVRWYVGFGVALL